MFAFLKNNSHLCPCLTSVQMSVGASVPRYRHKNKSLRSVVSVRCDCLPKWAGVRQGLGFFVPTQLCLTPKKLAPHCRRTAPSWSRSSKPRTTSAQRPVSSTTSALPRIPNSASHRRTPFATWPLKSGIPFGSVIQTRRICFFRNSPWSSPLTIISKPFAL